MDNKKNYECQKCNKRGSKQVWMPNFICKYCVTFLQLTILHFPKLCNKGFFKILPKILALHNKGINIGKGLENIYRETVNVIRS